MIPWWAKVGGVAVAANEVRGALVFVAGIGDLKTHGLHPGQLWLLALVVLPLLATWAWKRRKARRLAAERIARRLQG